MMIPCALKSIVRRAFNSVGLELHRRDISSRDNRYQRSSLQGILQQAKSLGLSPATVIDVGAAYGAFALQCYHIFPEAMYVLIEPLEEYKPFLEAVDRCIPDPQYVFAAARAESGKTAINVHPDLVGSSLYREEEESDVNGVPRTVRTVTLDSLIKDGGMKPPFLLKIDVQGAELDVLMGAEVLLHHTDYVLLEVSFFQFFKGGPQFYDVVVFMESRGFVAYDIYGLKYRLLDNALSQIDMAFVKKEGLFRKHHSYATREQRELQNKTFEMERRDRMSKGR